MLILDWFGVFQTNGVDYLYSKKIEKQKQSIHNFVVFGIRDKYIEDMFGNIRLEGQTVNERRLEFRKKVSLQYKKIEPLGGLNRLQSLERLNRLQGLEGLNRLAGLETSSIDYREYKYKEGDIVYLDPPYENTLKYLNKSFNHKEFYDWVATRPFQVWFSSFEISDNRFQKVWTRKRRVLCDGARSLIYRNECLYTNKKTNLL